MPYMHLIDRGLAVLFNKRRFYIHLSKIALVQLVAILLTLPTSCIWSIIRKIQCSILTQFRNHLSTELFDHVQRRIMAKGPLLDKGHHLEAGSDQRQEPPHGLLDEPQIGAQHDLASIPIGAPWRASPLPLGFCLCYVRRSCRLLLVHLFHPDRVGGAALHTHQGSAQKTPPRDGLPIQ